jgi:hypothetical protein
VGGSRRVSPAWSDPGESVTPGSPDQELFQGIRPVIAVELAAERAIRDFARYALSLPATAGNVRPDHQLLVTS